MKEEIEERGRLFKKKSFVFVFALRNIFGEVNSSALLNPQVLHPVPELMFCHVVTCVLTFILIVLTVGSFALSRAAQ